MPQFPWTMPERALHTCIQDAKVGMVETRTVVNGDTVVTEISVLCTKKAGRKGKTTGDGVTSG